jgi:hypothetical protein
VYTLAHLSDSHVTSVRIPGLRSMLNKRIFSWCKWSFERRKIHRPEVLDALVPICTRQLIMWRLPAISPIRF